MPRLSRIIVDPCDPDALDLPTALAIARAVSANRAIAESLIAAGWPQDHVSIRLCELVADQAEELLCNEASPQTIAAAKLAAAGELQTA